MVLLAAMWPEIGMLVVIEQQIVLSTGHLQLDTN